jgi:hypothetical protein
MFGFPLFVVVPFFTVFVVGFVCLGARFCAVSDLGGGVLPLLLLNGFDLSVGGCDSPSPF